MPGRNLPFEPWTNVILNGPPNWTAVAFFGALGGMHLAVSVPSFFAGYWEGYLSGVLGLAFCTVSVACVMMRSELAVLKDEKRLRLRHGIRTVAVERSIPFEQVTAIRVTLVPPPRQMDSRIELICDGGDVDCPPTPVPRQFALYLALTMNVRLIRISPDQPDVPASHRLNSL